VLASSLRPLAFARRSCTTLGGKAGGWSCRGVGPKGSEVAFGMTALRGLQASRRCWRSRRGAEFALPRSTPLLPRVEPAPSFEGLGSRGQALRRWLYASPEIVRRLHSAGLAGWSPASAALPAGARESQGVKYLPGTLLPPNQWLERTAQQLRCWVPSALRAAAAAQPQRSASNGHFRVGD